MAFDMNVISKLSKKDSATGFDTPYPIGTEAKYVSGVRGSNVNNIEEQFLIGFDCITTTEILIDGTEHIIQEFRDDTTSVDFYLVETHNFANINEAKQFLKDNALYLPNDLTDNKFTSDDQPAGAGSVTLIGEDTSVYSFSADNSQIDIIAKKATGVPVISLSVLKYKNATSLVPVAEKILYKAQEVNGKVVQKQIIKNLL